MAEPQVDNTQVDDVLNFNLDDVEDVAEFITPPVGSYKLRVTKVETKTVDKMDNDVGRKIPTPLIDITYEVVETTELAKAGTAPVANGTKCSENFWLDKPEYFKLYLKNVFGAEALAGRTLGELVAQLDGVTMQTMIKNREYNGNTYMSTRAQSLI